MTTTTKKKTTTTRGKIPVLITTDKDKRGVFFGYISEDDRHLDDIQVSNVQMCVYWSAEMRGVLGLAAIGPDVNFRVSPPVKLALVKGVTFIAECSDEAVSRWLAQPWSA